MISNNSPSENYMCRQMKEWTIMCTEECDGVSQQQAGAGETAQRHRACWPSMFQGPGFNRDGGEEADI